MLEIKRIRQCFVRDWYGAIYLDATVRCVGQKSFCQSQLIGAAMQCLVFSGSALLPQ